MEQRLDDLMAMLQNRNQLQNPTPELTPTPVSQLRSPSSDSMLDSPFSETYPSTLMLQKAIGLAPQLSEMCKSPDADVNDSKDLISKGIVTVEQATEYLNLFRLKISCFPFVVVSSETSLDELRAKKPFLLLAILAFGSAQSYNLQTKVIETELLEILGRRNTSKGEKSLDLLQGLMIYVSRYVSTRKSLAIRSQQTKDSKLPILLQSKRPADLSILTDDSSNGNRAWDTQTISFFSLHQPQFC